MEGSKDDYLSGGGDHYDGEVTHDDGNPDRSRRDNEVDWRERDQQGYYDEDRREKMQDSKNDDGNDPAENKGNNLYITNLSFETTDESLGRRFSEFGEVKSASVVKEPVSLISRGFGFVSFTTVEASERAIQSMNGGLLDGRTIKVEYARRSSGYEKTPGKYLGPPQMSTKTGRRDGGGYGGGGSYPRGPPRGGYERDYERDRFDRPYRGGGGGGGGYSDRPAPYRDDRGGRFPMEANPHGGPSGYRDDRYVDSYRGKSGGYMDRREPYPAAPYDRRPPISYESKPRPMREDYRSRDDYRGPPRGGPPVGYDRRGGYSEHPYESRSGYSARY